MLESVRHSWFIRMADAAHQQLEARGTPLLKFEPDVLKATACRRSGLSDFGDARFEEGLEVLCRSAREDANLNLYGQLMLQQMILTALVNRLRRIDLRRTQPEIFEQPLNNPVMVMGLPRSGTTHLHRLLALNRNARALKTWEVREPLPGSGPDFRRIRTDLMVKHVRRTAPALDAKHHIDVDKAEECVFLLEDSFESFSFWMFFPVYSYEKWLRTRDPEPSYRAYREYLQIFQAQTPNKRLVLKAPPHCAHLATLAKVLPEATLVHTHRDPVPVMGSVNSLFHTIFSLVSRGVDHHRLGPTNLEAFGWTMDRSLDQRDAVPPGKLVDVRYPDMVADPVGTVARVCTQAGLDFDRAAVQHRIDNRPQRLFGKHEYSLGETGLTEEGVRERFGAYRRAFSLR